MNDAERFERAMALFGELCDLPAVRREARLVTLCGDDIALRRQVEALLEQDSGSAETLNDAAAGGAIRALAESVVEDTGAWPPEHIGRYRVVRQLGEGGMGVVFEAEQDNPKRRVALKVIRRGLGTSGLARRFQQEAFVLGQLRHPGVAQVYDAGSAEVGDAALPFFAMELIEGEPLDVAMASRTAPQRLELMARVCDAVQHAHQKGVIHRDLKPGNVLVVSAQPDAKVATPDTGSGSAVLDLVGQPKVLDFGIARLTDADLQVTTIQTQAGQIVGTLGYMSPEQISGDSERIDTRCDVYAAGVLLYQSLSGRLPHEIRDKPIALAAAMILDEEPARLGKLDPALRGDVETIVAKAMDKDVDRRYASMAELAADLRRHLNHEPITARPATTIYQLRKFAKRNRGLVGGMLAAFVALVIGLLGTVYYLSEATQQRNEAVAARDEATRVARFQAAQLEGIDLPRMGARMRDALIAAAPEERRAELEAKLVGINFTDLARKALERNIFSRSLDAIDEQFAESTPIRARLLQSVASSLMPLGLTELAVEPQRRAIAIRTELLGAEHADTLRSRTSQGLLHLLLDDVEAAEPLLRETLRAQRRQFGDEHEDTLSTLHALGSAAQRAGDYPAAQAWFEQALAGRRRVLGDDHRLTLTSLSDLGLTLYQQGKHDRAETHYLEALEKQREVLGDDHAATVNTLTYVAALLARRGEYGAAEPLFREALETRRRVFGEDHHYTLMSTGHVGYILRMLNRLDEAEPYYRRSVAGSRRVLGDEHSETLTAINNLGSFLSASGKHGEAESCYREAVAGQRSVYGDGHPETLRAINNLAFSLYNQGRYADAEPLFRESFDGQVALHGRRHPSVLTAMHNMGMFAMRLGKLDEAAAFVREAVATRGEVLGADHPDTLASAKGLGEVYEAQGDLERAVDAYRESVRARRRALGDDHPDTAVSVLFLANALEKQAAWADATDARRLGVRITRKAEELPGPRVAAALRDLGQHLLLRIKRDAELEDRAALFREAESALTESVSIWRERGGADLWRAQSLLGAMIAHDPTRFTDAEQLLVEAARQLEAAAAGTVDRKHVDAARRRVSEAYTARHETEPEAGHDARAADWQSRIGK